MSTYDKGNLPDDPIILPKGPVKGATLDFLVLAQNIVDRFPNEISDLFVKVAYDSYKAKIALYGSDPTAPVKSVLDNYKAPRSEDGIVPLVFIARAVKRKADEGYISATHTTYWKDSPTLKLAAQDIVGYAAGIDNADIFCLNALLAIPLDAHFGNEIPMIVGKQKILRNILNHSSAEPNVSKRVRNLLTVAEHAMYDRSPLEQIRCESGLIELQRAVSMALKVMKDPALPPNDCIESHIEASKYTVNALPEMETEVANSFSRFVDTMKTPEEKRHACSRVIKSVGTGALLTKAQETFETLAPPVVQNLQKNQHKI